jgi:hypothetical protein
MYPDERSLVAKLKNRPFALLGINSDSNKIELSKVLKQEGITWRSWWNGGSPKGGIAAAWNVHAWPTIYVLDHKGVIRYQNLRGSDLQKAVRKLLDEMNTEVAKRPASKPTPKSTVSTKSAPTVVARDDPRANSRLRLARILLDDGNKAKAQKWLEGIVNEYPSTEAADEARKLLAEIANNDQDRH